MPQAHFDEWIAQRYELLWPDLFDPSVLDPTVDFVAELAGSRPRPRARSRNGPRGVAAQPST